MCQSIVHAVETGQLSQAGLECLRIKYLSERNQWIAQKETQGRPADNKLNQTVNAWLCAQQGPNFCAAD